MWQRAAALRLLAHQHPHLAPKPLHLAEEARKPPRLSDSQCWSAEQGRQALASLFVGRARASSRLVAGGVRRRRHGVYGMLAIT
ncbi:hypothetical protein ARMA_1580 [Ardenticatena maritima]|uniref:Uncharacterized protein n=1 Tax=Ardenticatena maritima TaxID=872965 RepID=A0A0M9UCS4_9CHLR|nr:hypothetical protein ARMA_1580 [Ardenticatena maritima]